MARSALGLCFLASLTGCTRPNPGFDPPSASGGDTTEAMTSATTTPDPVTSAPTTGDPTSGSDSVGTGGPGSTDPGSTTEAIATTEPEATTTTTSTDGSSSGSTTEAIATTEPEATTTTTTSTDGSSSGSTSTTDGSESSTGNIEPPPPEHLQLYDEGRCDVPLWCFGNGDKFNGLPLRTGSQACFTPSTSPPYTLTRIGYRIAARFGEVAKDARLQVHARTDNGPGELLFELPVTDEQLGIGAHALVTAKVIGVPGFCVGFVGGGKNPDAGLGVGADPLALMPKQSYLRIEGGMAACNVPMFKDITTFEPKAPSEGAWCIDADVVGLP